MGNSPAKDFILILIKSSNELKDPITKLRPFWNERRSEIDPNWCDPTDSETKGHTIVTALITYSRHVDFFEEILQFYGNARDVTFQAARKNALDNAQEGDQHHHHGHDHGDDCGHSHQQQKQSLYTIKNIFQKSVVPPNATSDAILFNALECATVCATPARKEVCLKYCKAILDFATSDQIAKYPKLAVKKMAAQTPSEEEDTNNNGNNVTMKLGGGNINNNNGNFQPDDVTILQSCIFTQLLNYGSQGNEVLEFFNLLLEYDFDLSLTITAADGWTFLHRLCNINTFRTKSFADPNYRHVDKLRAEIFTELVSSGKIPQDLKNCHGPKYDPRRMPNRSSPLMIAAGCGALELVKELIANKFIPTSSDDEQMSRVFLADVFERACAAKGLTAADEEISKSIVEVLLTLPGSSEIKNESVPRTLFGGKRTALMTVAVRMKNGGAIRALLANNARKEVDPSQDEFPDGGTNMLAFAKRIGCAEYFS